MRALLPLSMLSALLLAACANPDDTGPLDLSTVDNDGDGSPLTEDCNDLDPEVSPTAVESCNGVDDDCDGEVDNDADDATTFYRDEDGDGFGTETAPVVACAQPVGYVTRSTDCDDTDPRYNPLAVEADCTDPNDYNCDGSVGYADVDKDGFAACEDCDDNADDVNDDAPEFCDGKDNDCNKLVDVFAVDAPVWYADLDADGFAGEVQTATECAAPDGYLAEATDCDDLEDSVFPGADEVCNGVDDDCDGELPTDELDGDSDAFLACEECDDTDVVSYPGAAEICDEADNDCDGATDEDATDAATWYLDVDGDGYGATRFTTSSCTQPSGYVADDTDCDDLAATTYPSAPELCNGVDDDCDQAVPANESDDDKDGFRICESDCDDDDANAKPGGTEVCDDADNDCDGDTDEDSAVDAATWYADDDGDTYGDPTDSTRACEQPSGYVVDDDDCDDDDEDNNPAADEVCDDDDNDCDGTTDEDSAIDAGTWYLDDDGDGYGVNASAKTACDAPTTSYVDEGGDCDDDDEDYNPGADEGCDGEDYDCDGDVDNDADGDGYADESCGGDDCDDDDDDIFPDSDGVCVQGEDCADLLSAGYTSSGTYTIDPDGVNTGEDPLDVYCDQTTDGGGWTLCASLTKGYVPAHMLYNVDAYAFQARKNNDRDFVYEREAPARTNTSWSNSETLNYGQFCRLMGTQSRTRIEAKMWNYGNNYGASLKNNNYNLVRKGIYNGNLFTQWFTNSSSSRSFSRISGDQLYVQTNNNGYGGPYTTPHVGWSSGFQNAPYTHSTNPWNGVGSGSSCTGCTNSSNTGYNRLPYGQTTILNNLSHSFWTGIPNVKYGWSDCTANGNCDYHESGFGVWLFWVK